MFFVGGILSKAVQFDARPKQFLEAESDAEIGRLEPEFTLIPNLTVNDQPVKRYRVTKHGRCLCQGLGGKKN
jgi:hypothetical protein